MSSRRPTAAGRGALQGAAVVVLAVMTAILLSPGPVDRPLYGTVLRGLRWLHRRGLPDWVDYTALEAIANVILFLPLGFLAGALLPARRWWLAVLLCAALSAGVESFQDVYLPLRQGTGQDLLLNTAGALAGASVAAAGQVLLAFRRRRRSARAARRAARRTGGVSLELDRELVPPRS